LRIKVVGLLIEQRTSYGKDRGSDALYRET
jgi:hypothetical protein